MKNLVLYIAPILVALAVIFIFGPWNAGSANEFYLRALPVVIAAVAIQMALRYGLPVLWRRRRQEVVNSSYRIDGDIDIVRIAIRAGGGSLIFVAIGKFLLDNHLVGKTACLVLVILSVQATVGLTAFYFVRVAGTMRDKTQNVAGLLILVFCGVATAILLPPVVSFMADGSQEAFHITSIVYASPVLAVVIWGFFQKRLTRPS